MNNVPPLPADPLAYSDPGPSKGCHGSAAGTQAFDLHCPRGLAVNAGKLCSPMKPRCVWSGHLKISLLTIPIRVYTALNEADKISFNQLHKDCHQRLKQQLVCPIHGKIEREHVVKGLRSRKGSIRGHGQPPMWTR